MPGSHKKRARDVVYFVVQMIHGAPRKTSVLGDAWFESLLGHFSVPVHCALMYFEHILCAFQNAQFYFIRANLSCIIGCTNLSVKSLHCERYLAQARVCVSLALSIFHAQHTKHTR